MVSTPEDFGYAFAFGADTSTMESPNAGVDYVKISQRSSDVSYA